MLRVVGLEDLLYVEGREFLEESILGGWRPSFLLYATKRVLVHVRLAYEPEVLKNCP